MCLSATDRIAGSRGGGGKQWLQVASPTPQERRDNTLSTFYFEIANNLLPPPLFAFSAQLLSAAVLPSAESAPILVPEREVQDYPEQAGPV